MEEWKCKNGYLFKRVPILLGMARYYIELEGWNSSDKPVWVIGGIGPKGLGNNSYYWSRICRHNCSRWSNGDEIGLHTIKPTLGQEKLPKCTFAGKAIWPGEKFSVTIAFNGLKDKCKLFDFIVGNMGVREGLAPWFAIRGRLTADTNLRWKICQPTLKMLCLSIINKRLRNKKDRKHLPLPKILKKKLKIAYRSEYEF